MKFSESFSIQIRENGRLLGRLTPDGRTTRKILFAAAFADRSTADRIAAEINGAGDFAASVVKF